MLNDPTTPLSLLATRRSGKPRDLVAPGPDAGQLATMLEIAARTPDHGKLAPWRFVHITDRTAFAGLLHKTAAHEPEPRDPVKIEQFARQAPTLIAVLATPVRDSTIPVWEQELSAGAACMNLLHAAHASGFAGGWLSGWPAFSATVLAALGGREGDRIAGFVFIGSLERPPVERPRPPADTVVRSWP
ncbi:MAG: nitroreductase [Pseudomonadota bacterium]